MGLYFQFESFSNFVSFLLVVFCKYVYIDFINFFFNLFDFLFVKLNEMKIRMILVNYNNPGYCIAYLT